MKEEALKYIGAGFSAIPIGNIKVVGKDKFIEYPLPWKQFQLRKMTEEEVNNTYFKNIGIVTGAISDLIVLDADSYKEGFDEELFKSLRIPPTPVQRTGRGGMQYFFKRGDLEIRNGVCIGHEGSGIDIRADGGMVIVAPSKTNTGEYEWILDPFDTPLADLPESVKKLISFTNNIKKTKPLSSIINLKDGEGRDNALASLVGRLCATTNPDLWEKEIPPVMSAINQTFKPPLPEEDLLRIYNSITTSDMRKRQQYREIVVPSQVKEKPEEVNIDSAISFSDFIIREYPKARFALEPFFELETVNMLSAPPNNWKSWFLFYISAMIAGGKKAFGKLETEKLGVMIVNEEDSARAIQDRFKTLGITDKDLNIHFHIAKGLRVDETFVENISKEMIAKGLKVLFLDSLRAVHDADENSSKEMQVVLDHLKGLSRMGITTIFTHHNRKRTMADKGDMAESTRGSSALNAAVSGHISLEEQVRETGTFIIVRHLKSKAVEKLQPFEVKILKENGKVSFEYGGTAQDGQKKVMETKDTIVRILQNERYETVNKLVEIGVASKSVVRQSIAELVKEGYVGMMKRSEALKNKFKLNDFGKANENIYFLIEHVQFSKDVELEMFTPQLKDN